MQLKTCTVCNEEKSTADFHKRSASKDGLSPKCKSCDKAQNAKWRAENAPKQKAQKKKYFAENSEKVKSANLEWQKANPDKVKVIVSKWRKTNRGKVNELGTKYRAARLQATPMWADQKAIALFYEEAEFASEFFGIPFQVDHIVPLQSDLVCGLHWEGNLQVLTTEENVKKSNRHWPDMPE